MQTKQFAPQEVAFRKFDKNGSPKAWQRKVATTAAAFDKLIDQLITDGADFECRDAEVSR